MKTDLHPSRKVFIPFCLMALIAITINLVVAARAWAGASGPLDWPLAFGSWMIVLLCDVILLAGELERRER